MRKAEPRWDIDVSYGEQGELQIKDYLEWIAAGNGRVEIKRKRFYDLCFYIETHCDKGRRGCFEPSGISVTAAQAWAFVIAESGVAVIVPTEHVRMMLDHVTTKDREEKDGTCPTRGRLINLAALLYEYKKRQEAMRPATDGELDWEIARRDRAALGPRP